MPLPDGSTPMPMPRAVILIRHGEKPDDPADPNLSARGWMRARAITQTLPAIAASAGLPPISAVVATAPSAHSVRPIETVTPISLIRGLPLDHSVADDAYQDLGLLLAQPMHDGATVLVCWHHGMLPNIAVALGGPVSQVPRKWDGDDFHSVWILTYERDGTPSFTVTRQPHLGKDLD